MTRQSLTRRRILVCGAIGVLSTSPLSALQRSASERVVFPTGKMRLTRRLSRSLRDGKAIVVTRSWAIDFQPVSQGASISGEQIAVDVDAPPALARLSEIEAARSTGMFPILLAPDGTLMAAGENTSQDTIDEAIKAAQELFEEGGLSKAETARQAQYMAQLQRVSASLLDELPIDLFYPSTEPYREVREVDIPDGGIGEFEVTWVATQQKDSALLANAKREVITRIGQSERRASEEWTLHPMP